MAVKCVSYGHAYVGSGWSAGGETTLHSLLSFLAGRGWDVEFVMSEPARNGADDYVVDGVAVSAYRDIHQPGRAIAQADLVISHLGGAQRSSIIAKNHGVNSVHLIHNDAAYTISMMKHAQYVLYNTNWIMDKLIKERVPRPPGMVIHPPVDYDFYNVRSKRKYITCVNLSDGTDGHYNKGAATFYEMAKRFPDEQFLAVRGAYGHQCIEDLPNVTFREHLEDIRVALRETKILLSPSVYESYGRMPIEAACSGIPTISSNATGFLESGISEFYEVHDDYDQWELRLQGVLENYKAHSTIARQKAKFLWERSEVELDVFEREMTRLARQKRRRR